MPVVVYQKREPEIHGMFQSDAGNVCIASCMVVSYDTSLQYDDRTYTCNGPSQGRLQQHQPARQPEAPPQEAAPPPHHPRQPAAQQARAAQRAPPACPSGDNSVVLQRMACRRHAPTCQDDAVPWAEAPASHKQLNAAFDSNYQLVLWCLVTRTSTRIPCHRDRQRDVDHARCLCASPCDDSRDVASAVMQGLE